MKTVIIGGCCVFGHEIQRLAAELGKSEDEILIILEEQLSNKPDFESLNNRELEEVILIKNRPSLHEYEQLPRRSKRKGHERPYKFHP